MITQRLALAVCLSGILGLLASCGASAQEVPTEYFFSPPPTTDVTVSPDGRYLAARSETAVQVLDFDSLAPVGRVPRDVEYATVSNYWWANSERIVITTRLATKRSDRDWPTHSFFAANADGKRWTSPYQLFRDGETRIGATIVDSADYNERNVQIERGEQPFYPHPGRVDPALMLLDVYTKADNARLRKRQRGPVPFGNLFPDREGNARFALGWLEGGKRTMFYRASPDSEWTDISAALGPDPSVTLNPVGFGDDGKLYVLSNHASDRIALYAMDPRSGEFELIREDDRFDTGEVEWNAAGTTIIGLKIDAVSPKFAVLDSGDPKIDVLRQTARTFQGEAVKIVSASKDGRRLVLFASSDRNPGAWHLMEPRGNKLRPLMALRRGINASQMAGSSAVNLKARDGMDLLSYLTVPNNPAPTVPMVVVPHAGPHGIRDSWTFDPVAQFFANRGFAVLRVNYRGSGGFGREFERAGYRQWGAAIIDDIVDATRSVAEQENIDANRVCILGTHYGAFAALAAVAREPDLYRCAAGHAGIYDLALLWGRPGVAPRHFGDEESLARWIGRDAAEHRAQSPVHHVAQIKVPVFLSHGGVDERAPLAHTTTMRSALESAGKTVTTLIETGKTIPERGVPEFLRGLMRPADAFHDGKDKARLYEAVLEFVREHTKPTAG
ncbi:MAG: prolyl oligopeptidase family serine peptidase [Gammaproteobacteria bacterium]|nr:prolyl oligopeptidase family serine peptidase [Gammaproteobacteria bacterium]